MNTIDNVKFVRLWVEAVNKSTDLTHVADKMEMSLQSVYAKANVLRSKGVMLPKMKRKQATGTVEELNALIERNLIVKA